MEMEGAEWASEQQKAEFFLAEISCKTCWRTIVLFSVTSKCCERGHAKSLLCNYERVQLRKPSQCPPPPPPKERTTEEARKPRLLGMGERKQELLWGKHVFFSILGSECAFEQVEGTWKTDHLVLSGERPKLNILKRLGPPHWFTGVSKLFR